MAVAQMMRLRDGGEREHAIWDRGANLFCSRFFFSFVMIPNTAICTISFVTLYCYDCFFTRTASHHLRDSSCLLTPTQ